MDGLTLTHRSAAIGNTETLILQVKRDATLLETADAKGQTPLMHAVVNQQMETTRILIKMGANINRQNKQGQTPLSMAAYQGWYDGVVFLLRNGARAAVMDKHGRHALHASTYPQNLNVMLLLVQSVKQIDLNQQDFEGMTALHWACFHNRPDHAQLLLEAGAAVAPTDVDGKTALHWAAQNGGTKCCQTVLGHPDGPKLVNLPDFSGKTPLHFAAAAGQTDALRALLSCPGVQVDHCDPDDRTPLHWAAAKGESKCVSLLLACGANPHRVDLNMGSPLHYAELSDSNESVRVLARFTDAGQRRALEEEEEDEEGPRAERRPLNFTSDIFARRTPEDSGAMPAPSKESPPPPSPSSPAREDKEQQANAAPFTAPLLPLSPLMALSVAGEREGEVFRNNGNHMGDDRLRSLRKPALPSIPAAIPSIGCGAALSEAVCPSPARGAAATTSSEGISPVLEEGARPAHPKPNAVLRLSPSPRSGRRRKKKRRGAAGEDEESASRR